MDDKPQIITPEKQQKPRRQHGSLVWPFILIGVGAIVLLNNLNVLQGNALDTLVKLWPLILVAIGLESLIKGHGMGGPLLLIALGGVFLWNNFVSSEWNAWELLARLWPVFIIAIGVDIIFGKRSTIGSVLGVVLIIAIVGGVLFFVGVSSPMVTDTISYELGDVTYVEASISPGVGSLYVSALPEGYNVVEGTLRRGESETLTKSYTVRGNKGVLRLGFEEEGFHFISFGGDHRKWDLKLTPNVPLDLSIDTGVGEQTLDLGQLTLKQLEINMGVGQTKLELPSGTYSVSIDGGVGELEVTLPRGVEVRMVTDSGLTSMHVPSEFDKGDHGEYTTANYTTTSGPKIDITLNAGIGKVTIRYK